MNGNVNADTGGEAAAAPYLAQYQLQQPPFSAGVDDSFFFADSSLTQRLDLLQHLTEFGVLLLVVSGERGSGKTSLLQQYLARAGANWQVCRIQGTVALEPLPLLQALAGCYGLDSGDDADELLSRLTEHLRALHEQGNLAVLAVDDAHALPHSTQEMLIQLWEQPTAGGRLLRVVLFGEPPLKDALKNRFATAVQDQTLHVVELPRLTEMQTAAYVRHRLGVAGLTKQNPFTPAMIKNIHKASEGVPGRINEEAHRQLLQQRGAVAAPPGAKPGKPARKRPVVRTAVIAVLIALIAGGVLLRDRIGTWLEPEADTEDQVVLHEPIPIAPPAAEDTAVSTQRIIRAPETAPSDAPDTEALADAPPEQDAAVPPPAGVEEAVEAAPEPEVVAAAATPVAPDTDAAPPAAPEAPPAAGPELPAQTPAQALVADAAPTPPVAAEPAPSVAPPTAVEPPPQAMTEPAPPVPAPQPAPAPAASAANATSPQPPQVEVEQWLLAQDPNAFTLQLLGARKEAALHNYIKRHLKDGPVAIFHTYFQDRDWYALLYGIYPDRKSALAAIDRLPAAVRKNGPWARTLASVHEDIHKPAPMEPAP